MSIAEKITRAKADLDEVYAAGKQAAYDAFWDVFQDYGKRVDYRYGFGGIGWNDATFYPKYDIKPDWAIVGIFEFCDVTDLEARLKECGVVLDTSHNANYSGMFDGAKCTVIPELVIMGGATGLSGMFLNCKCLHTIRKITLREGFNVSFGSAFQNCTALENVVFDGVIPKNIDIRWSTKLTKASITSVINALSITTTGQTATFSQTAVNNAFATSEGAADGSTSAEWLALVATRPNWNIVLQVL